MTQGPLTGKTALITGATGAIAQETAKLLARDGAHVALMARRASGLEDVANAIRSQVPNTSITLIAGDCCSETDVQRAVAEVCAERASIDILFATVGGGAFKPLMMLTPAEIEADFSLNVISAFLAIRHVAPVMPRGGSIILTSSTSAKMPFAYLASYHIAKAAVEALMASAAEELGHAGIRVNAVRPGMTRSQGTSALFEDAATLKPYLDEYPIGRLGEPEDIAGAVRFLAGPESSWMTGQSFAVDGGNELRKNPDVTSMVEAIFGKDVIDAARAARPIPNS